MTPIPQLHILTNFPALMPLTPRRPRRADLEMDWVGLIVGGSITKRVQGEQVSCLIVSSFDESIIYRSFVNS